MNTAIRRKAPHHMTVDEFIAWSGDGRWQLVDVEPRAMALASATHGIIQARLAFLLNQHLYARSSPCVAVTEPAIAPRVRAQQYPGAGCGGDVLRGRAWADCLAGAVADRRNPVTDQ